VFLQTNIMFFSYSTTFYKLLELDIFDKIVLSLCLVTRLANKNKYEDYNL
jgi:hypothetical protein